MTDIKVLIVDDEPAIAKFLESSLKDAGYDIAGVAFSFEEAQQLLKEESVDIAILDINLGSKRDGIDLAILIKKSYNIPFIFLTSYAHKGIIARAKLTQPMGYIMKPFTEGSLNGALEIAMYNYAQAYKSDNMTRTNLNALIDNPLSAKEYEVLVDIFEGKTNQQIGEKQFISINTVKTHVRNVYFKLNVNNRWTLLIKLRELLAH